MKLSTVIFASHWERGTYPTVELNEENILKSRGPSRYTSNPEKVY